MDQDDTGSPSDAGTPAATDTAMDITPKPGPAAGGAHGAAAPAVPAGDAAETPKEPTDTAMDITPAD